METGQPLMNDRGPFPAPVPGTVQTALLQAGVIEDWHVGLNSLRCEWVEHRHWELRARVPGGGLAGARKIVLDAQGLDYSGWVIVDGEEVAEWRGVLRPQRFDLTERLADGEDHLLRIVFDQPPEEQGQIAYTSRSQYFKPRYNYSWDWCPRMVPIGVWGAVALKTDLEAELEAVKVWSDLGDDLETGRLSVDLRYEPVGPPDELTVAVRVMEGNDEVACREEPLQAGEQNLPLEALTVEPWWPNGEGAQKTYTLTVEVFGADAETVWEQRRQVGFRCVRWLPCEGAPEDAEPWICEVNGRAIFLQGVNWAPVRLNYADVTDEQYRHLVAMYREMACNIVRVWGGGILEPEVFYDACDEAGIFVWQEFPLSSSGLDNWPPEDPEAIEELCAIARSYIQRRAHHPSLLMWCGGNELLGGPDGSKVGSSHPAPPDHPALAAMAQVVREEDPTRRYVQTSPSGPRAHCNPAEAGKGLHHDVHGPWGIGGARDLEGWKEHWRVCDALMVSEIGMPAACDVELIKRYLPDDWWPPSNDAWAHSSLWWLMWERYREELDGLPPEEAPARYVQETQEEQCEALRIAAESCKRRFPRCGGFLIWTGHDCFPCAINNSVIDFEGEAKPGYWALREVFLRRHD